MIGNFLLFFLLIYRSVKSSYVPDMRSWRHFLMSRCEYVDQPNIQDVVLSAVYSYPLTIANYIMGQFAMLYYLQFIVWFFKLLVTFLLALIPSNESGDDCAPISLSLALLGARFEATAPIYIWQELLDVLQHKIGRSRHLSISIHMMGPGAASHDAVDLNHFTRCRDGRVGGTPSTLRIFGHAGYYHDLHEVFFMPLSPLLLLFFLLPSLLTSTMSGGGVNSLSWK